MANPRILTFNFHEPYLCLMAKTGLPFTVGLYEQAPLARIWQTRYRPIPNTISFLEESQWRADLSAGRFDLVIAQNETNAASLFREIVAGRTPGLLVCHNRKTFLKTTLAGRDPNEAQAYETLLQRLQERFAFVFISESKRDDYNMPGSVILPGLDVAEYGGYHGEVAEVLRVGNMMRARNRMFDVDLQERICADFPNRVVGEDPTIPGATPSASFDALLNDYRRLRCLLHVTCEDWEDGYNLSMLEAMACGMPVVALANRTSPLTDGVDGFLAKDPEVLRQRLRDLLSDRNLARTIGARGRETVAAKFPLQTFVDRWRETIECTVKTSGRAGAAPPELPRLKLLVQSVCSPITTARYLESALRERHEVVTAGVRVPEELLAQWGFPGPAPAYPPHTLDLALESTYGQMLAGLPAEFKPDLFVWLDSGLKALAPDFDQIKVPKACYMVDTHIAPEPRIEIARQFHFTFLAQKAQVPLFAEAGVSNVAWLPLACAPELHDAAGTHDRVYDVAYVGRLSEDAGDRRRRLIQSVAARFPNHKIGMFWPLEMATIYAQSKIVINACVSRDLNMRVFEAMAAGALLITDNAEGLHDLFEEGTHFVLYRNDVEALELIDRYLRDEAARERIARAAQALVRREHTYARRMDEMLRMVMSTQEQYSAYAGEGRFHQGGYYRQPRPELAAQVPINARRVLDCGCGAGDFGRSLKRRGVKEVVGIEVVERAWKIAKQVLDDAILGNVEQIELPFEDNYFDCICFGDVLEHLVEPAAVLRKVARTLTPDGIIVMSIPNIRYFQTIEMLLNGRWKYESAGIMDRTHLRFFAATDMKLMVEEAGLQVARLQPLSMVPEEYLPRNPDGSLQLGRATLRDVSDAEYQDLRVYQYLVVATKPDPDPLKRARTALEQDRNEEAYGIAETATDADPFERTYIMARAVARTGKLDTAEKLYREALALRPEHPRILGELGILLLGMNRVAEARPYLDRAHQLDESNDRVIAALGLVHLTNQETGQAFERFRESLTIRYHNESVQCHLIQTAYTLNRLDEAEPLLRAFVDFYPGNIGMAYNYAAMLYKLGRIEEARDRLDTLLLLSPGYEPAHELLASMNGA